MCYTINLNVYFRQMPSFDRLDVKISPGFFVDQRGFNKKGHQTKLNIQIQHVLYYKFECLVSSDVLFC